MLKFLLLKTHKLIIARSNTTGEDKEQNKGDEIGGPVSLEVCYLTWGYVLK